MSNEQAPNEGEGLKAWRKTTPKKSQVWMDFYFPYGGFLKWWYPTTMGFPTKNDHFGVFWGYHHLRKHAYRIRGTGIFTNPCMVDCYGKLVGTHTMDGNNL